MKTIAIGDIHGLPVWKDIIKAEGDFDRVVFVGDYVDSFYIPAEQQLQNLRGIVEFKKSSDKEVILLIGNHDFHYLPGVTDYCSGYQPDVAHEYTKIYSENRSLFKVAFMDENNYLFSHAGVTEPWMKEVGLFPYNIPWIAPHLNELMLQTPQYFYFYPGDRSGYGDHVKQSPIWVRPNALYKSQLKDVTQIVGHTPQLQHRIDPLKSNRQGYWLIDALSPKVSDYLVIQDGKINVHTLLI